MSARNFPWRIPLFALAVAFAPWPVHAGLFDPASMTLSNGLEVVVITDRRAPVINQMIWYKVGSADEPRGKSGVAHLLEHLMFKGTKTLKSGEFSKIVAGFGGQENAFTAHDVTAYYQVVASQHLATVMRHEADRMRNLVFSEAEAKSELNVVLEERLGRIANDPAAEFGERMDAAQFLQHPYARPVIGWESDLRSLTRADALQFYRQHYAPNNAILLLIGDLTMTQARPLAEKYFGPIAAQPPGAAKPDASRAKLHEFPPQAEPRRVDAADPRVRQPLFRRTYLAPSQTAGETEHAIPLMAFSQILGGGPTGRLYRELVKEQGLAADASSWYDGASIGPSVLGIQVTARNVEELPAIEAAVDRMIGRALEQGVTQSELDRTKTSLLAQVIYARDSVLSAGRQVGMARATGLSLAEFEAWPDKVQALNVETVNAAARHVLDARRSVTGTLIRGAAKAGP